MSQPEWKAQLGAKVEELVDGFVVIGAKQEDVFEAIIQEVSRLRAALELDPDPAADSSGVEEPANDWPAAARD
ncbi:hypothetical protein Rleg4DRAFT_6971 [Rhizobium leguminosarum bv. trifolii WSM2297]|uniref:Uncharacterized protein n=1 Tax=Rhizobium leguminosarum bv. trifolii WSM2297 TaxID=754762 RepID=J0WDK8_RHILT|nr:hypothetical protein [Rhizobium leguminosarum]EJC83298.1 hypothetical protein Rleg4DRAFT_5050 [Rhizobium leguminosarum bv. trifolii WSM2297]EJC85108.1 hypothetical protein Rleg4DRAFT_6971 [Rhizobium leguminosarum bv. trifolii WSM2297]